jgi:hypothetical protein
MRARSRFAYLSGLLSLLLAACASDSAADATSGTAADTDDVTAACLTIPACDAAPPEATPTGFAHTDFSDEDPHHRGRDLILRPTDDAWAMAKFAYGTRDRDAKDEAVDVYLEKSCGGAWELVTTAYTSSDGDNPTVEDVEDTGGRVFVNLGKLPVGRHRVHFVLRADASRTEAFIEVLAPGQKVFVTDIDGTLTSSEFAEFPALLTGDLPAVHPDAAAALSALAARGYRPFFLTARPEYLGERTRQFLSQNGFPPGVLHTTLTLTGAVGSSAQAFKSRELALLAERGFVPSFAFGNKPSDAEAFTGAGISAKNIFLYQQTDEVYGCHRIEAYSELLPLLSTAKKGCK